MLPACQLAPDKLVHCSCQGADSGFTAELSDGITFRRANVIPVSAAVTANLIGPVPVVVLMRVKLVLIHVRLD